jgi:hypothetical protein
MSRVDGFTRALPSGISHPGIYHLGFSGIYHQKNLKNLVGLKIEIILKFQNG